mmetsp:Transcript_22636/g.73205  ORF Transcript_22636/g.73205 Transcript_22636/m.73205 type:complete len:242 (+) Transcript_22636:28-753(+)
MLATLLLLGTAWAVGFTPSAAHAARFGSVRAGPVVMESLAQKMLGTLVDGVKGMADAAGIDLSGDSSAPAESQTVGTPRPSRIEGAVADIDARARSGELTFDDFLMMAKAYASMGDGALPGVLPGQLSAEQLKETRDKFGRHTSMVEVMLPDEKADPSLLIDDLKKGGSTPGPRIQRIAAASNQPETEVALFLMQFEAMRESTRRIAAGEDPDAVNKSMMEAPPGSNRKARRSAKAKNKKK